MEPSPKRAKLERAQSKVPQHKIFQGPLQNLGLARQTTALFAGTANRELATATAEVLGLPLGDVSIGQFADGEVNIKVNESVRKKDVYIIQPTCRSGPTKSVNDSLMELLLLVSCMRRASAGSIVAVIPYFGYARQDRKVASRTPISAADVSALITSMGVDRVICVDLHCGQIQGFFPPTVPVDNLNAGLTGAYYFAGKEGLQKPCIVSPDAGGVGIAKEFRRIIVANGHPETGLSMLIKQRVKANEIDRMDLVGDVSGCDCIIVDDMVDTAGTLCEAAKQLRNNGARRVYAFITHGLLNGPAADRIAASHLDELVVSDTVPLPDKCRALKNVTQLSVAPVLAETIRCNIEGISLGPNLFN